MRVGIALQTIRGVGVGGAMTRGIQKTAAEASSESVQGREGADW